MSRLRHVDDRSPGLRRVRVGPGFAYRDTRGRPVRAPVVRGRIRHLAIPPAWSDVWICPQPNGHIQATGRDARRRKQYIYHEAWRKARDATKYHRLVEFGSRLPRLRRAVATDLGLPGLPREKILAAAVRLLDRTGIRVGNESYAETNHSFGLSTLRDSHVSIRGPLLQFRFVGKSGRFQRIDLGDPRLARIVRAAQELPGQQLFQYVDESGRRRRITSDDINRYIRRLAGPGFSAKDFRTWAGTRLAAGILRRLPPARPSGRKLNEAIDQVARALGNTRSICLTCYVHPAVVRCYLSGRPFPRRGERALLRFLALQTETRRTRYRRSPERPSGKCLPAGPGLAN